MVDVTANMAYVTWPRQQMSATDFEVKKQTPKGSGMDTELRQFFNDGPGK